MSVAKTPSLRQRQGLSSTWSLLAASMLASCTSQPDPRQTALRVAESFRQGWGYAPAGPTETVSISSRNERWAVT